MVFGEDLGAFLPFACLRLMVTGAGGLEKKLPALSVATAFLFGGLWIESLVTGGTPLFVTT